MRLSNSVVQSRVPVKTPAQFEQYIVELQKCTYRDMQQWRATARKWLESHSLDHRKVTNGPYQVFVPEVAKDGSVTHRMIAQFELQPVTGAVSYQLVKPVASDKTDAK